MRYVWVRVLVALVGAVAIGGCGGSGGLSVSQYRAKVTAACEADAGARQEAIASIKRTRAVDQRLGVSGCVKLSNDALAQFGQT